MNTIEKIRIFAKTHSKSIFSFLLVVFFLGGFWLGKGTEKNILDIVENNFQIRQKGDYKFINPLLECDSFSDGNFLKAKELEKKIKETTDEIIKNPVIEHISVYFRDLNNGPWLGINEDEKFTPASLLKVPIMLAYFKKAENDPSFLKEEIIYSNKFGLDQVEPNIQSTVKVEDGKKYSVEEMIEIMIEHSDNNAANFLLNNIDRNFLNKVYSDLMLPIPGQSSNKIENFMTVKEYASFFRILYNASYLSKEMSERALNLLSKTDFKNGLESGLPQNIEVAHKFGERRLGNLVQLHDCGIIYKEEKPYLLCIMTRGSNFEKLEKIIGEISKEVWKETEEN